MRLAGLATAAVLAFAPVAPASAAPVSGTYGFSFAIDSNPATFEGEISLAFDDAADGSGPATIVSGNFLTSGSGIGYDYNVASGVLTIGDLLNGVLDAQFGTTDFFILIIGATQPVVDLAVIVYAIEPDFIASSEGTVTFTSDAVPVPEPATLGVFGIGLAGLLALRRRRGA